MFEIASNLNLLKSRRKKNKIDQCCFDCFNSDFQRQKCSVSFVYVNDVKRKHDYDHDQSDDR